MNGGTTARNNRNNNADPPEGYFKLSGQKRYSYSTKKTDTAYFKDFIDHFVDRSLAEICTEEMKLSGQGKRSISGYTENE